MKVLFIHPEDRVTYFGFEGICRYRYPHLGMAYLISVLRQHGIEVDIFYEGDCCQRNNLAKFIKESNPDLIGLTIWTITRKYAYKIIEDIKAICNIPVVIGGPHVSDFKKLVFEESLADFAVKREGEYTLLELVETLGRKTKEFTNINGLLWRDNGSVIENVDRQFIDDLNSLPFADFGLFDIVKNPFYGRRIAPIATSRGCPFRCNFCSSTVTLGKAFRARSAKKVFEEIVHHYENGYTLFDFNEDCFSYDMKRAQEILDMIIISKIDVKLRFVNGLRVDRVNKTLLNKLKKAGCLLIAYGCESGNESILNSTNKGITLEQIRTAIRLTKEAGIATDCFFIVGHKGETYQDALDTIDFAKSLNTVVNFKQLFPVPSIEIFDWVVSHSIFLKKKGAYLDVSPWLDTEGPIFETKEFTADQRRRVLKKAFALQEFTLLRFRFGKIVGYLLFLLTRNLFLKRTITSFALANGLGNKISALFFKHKE